MPRSQATPEQFVIAWQSSRTIDEAAQRLGMRPRTVQERARRYREAGIPLRPLYVTDGPYGIDVEALSKLALEVGAKTSTSFMQPSTEVPHVRDGVVLRRVQ